VRALVFAGWALNVALCAQAQGATAFPLLDTYSSKEKGKPLQDHGPDKSTFPAAFTVPVDPLGFSAPGAIYLGERSALVSLDFLDEDRLLFTFRVPGLLHRDTTD
jgi:hypothetical protein